MDIPTSKINIPKWNLLIPGAVLLLFCAGVLSYHLLFGPIRSLGENGVLIEVKKGMGARQVAIQLKNNGVISSETLFVALVSFSNNENGIAAGTYLFEKPVGILEAVKRIVTGEYNIDAKKITIPEGFTNIQIAERFEANLPGFKKDVFLNLASTTEGYLYPETYFFLPSDDEVRIYTKLIDTFNESTKSLEDGFATSLRSKQEIVIMASILEREVQSKEDKKIVSGILWNRIKIGMPLQVDATLAYERDKDSYTLTTADLKKDSAYNTYTRKGLPPTPISNPGFDAIEASLLPTANQYLYFLTDKQGKVYYAKTYAEHLKNKTKYFNK